MFLIFALITLLGALSVAFQKNLVVAGLSLVLTFLGVAGLFLLLSNPVAAALRAHSVQRWGAVLMAVVLAVGAVRVVLKSEFLARAQMTGNPPPMNLDALGTALFTNHLAAFEIVGLLLLAAMVGAVALVKRDL